MTDQDALDILAVLDGQVDQFARLVGRHQSAMFRYALSRLASRALAEEAVQETFLAVYQSRAGFDPNRPFRPWLWSILVNTCRRIAKTEARIAKIGVAAIRVPSAAGGASCVERDDERRMLSEFLDRLPDEQADALRMRFFGELSYDEIGAVCHCAPATAKSRVRYALDKLTDWMKSKQEFFR